MRSKLIQSQEIRELFGIECDFTEEELAKIKEENAWHVLLLMWRIKLTLRVLSTVSRAEGECLYR